MAPRPGTYQSSFTGGVVDPSLAKRSDLEVYERSLADGRNLDILPQGGVRGAAGSLDIGTVRGTLSALVPQTNTLAGGIVTAPAVLGQASFATDVLLAAFDLNDLKGSAYVTNGISVETTLDFVNWTALGPVADLDVKTRTRRFAAPPGAPRLVRAVRVRLVAGTAITVSLAGSAAFAEGTDLPLHRTVPFTYSASAAYDLIFTPGNIDVWGYNQSGNDVWLAAIPSPYAASHIYKINPDQSLESFKVDQSLDVMFLWHQEVQPWRIARLGLDTAWDSRPTPLVNIPRYDYGGVYTNGVTDQWRIEFVNWTSADYSGELTVLGEKTTAFTVAGLNWSGFAATLKTLIEALPNVETGISVVFESGTKFLVSFTGAGNEGPWATMTGLAISTTSAAITCSHVTRGVKGGEDIMSQSRGWPRCGRIWNQRLWMGGITQLPQALICSVAGEYYDLDTTRSSGENGLVLPLDVSADEAILELFSGRNFQIFTSAAEYWISDRSIDATKPPTIVLASKNGIAGGIPVVENEGTSLYVHKNRSVIMEYDYDLNASNYASLNISLLSSFLVTNVRDAALQRANQASDANRYLLVDEAGRLVVWSILRAQSQQAPCPRITDGLFKSVSVNGRNEITVTVERMINGVKKLVVERIKSGLLLEQSVIKTLVPASNLVTGLERLEGASVWVIADDSPIGPFTVASGSLTLPNAVSSVSVGRFVPPVGETLDLPIAMSGNVVMKRKRRVHTIRADLLESTSFAISANGGSTFDVPLVQHDDSRSTPELQRSYTGERVLTNLQGWSYGGRVRFTQLRPGRFLLRSLTLEA